MTSAEWDLRALKALEQEQEKHKKHQQQQPQPHLKKHTYLGLSQRSLYDPSPSSSLPITPPSLKKSLVKQLPTANTQHFIHTALKERSAVPVPAPATNASNSSASSASASNSYVQLQAQQLLKLPTISEHHQQYLLAQKKRGGGKDSAGGKLKFSKVLSLSAQSLTNRLGSRKSKNKSGSSPGHYVASSPPMYTPPPTRRCNTLHHTPQVRKTFKTLQELERRKLEGRPGELQITRTLHRIAGTHKTYWKYGINSTANSIVGQHQQKQQQQQNLPQQRGSQPKRGHNSELESYTSDELDSEENQSPEQPDNKDMGLESRGEPKHKEEGEADEEGEGLAFDFDDNATEVGSCTVPLASDSIEMMNLMLSAAQTAVITHPSITANQPTGDPPQPPPPDLTAIINSKDNRVSTAAAATGGGGGVQIPKYFTLGHSQQQQQQQHQQQHRHHSFNRFSDTEEYVVASPPLASPHAGGSFLPLHPHPQNGETVAFKALQQLARRKSFSGEKMRAHSLQRNVSLNYSYGDDDDYGEALQQPEDSTENGNDSDQNSEEQNHGNDGQGDDDDVNNSSVLNITSTVMRANSTRRQSRSYVNNRTLLKASSLDVPPSALVYTTDFNVPNSTTIITNPLMNATAQHHHTHHGHHPATLNLLKPSSSGKPLKTSAQIKQKLLAVGSNNKSPFNDLNSVRLRPPGGHNLQQLSPASMVHSPPSDGGDEALHQFAPQHLHLNFHHASTLSPDIYDNACTNGELCSAAMSSLIIDDELEQHIKQCSCSCNHMGYGNSMDYQTTGFGGLPDVTEHSNIRRNISRQNSTSNSDSGGEIASIQKSKVNFNDIKSPSDVGDPLAGDVTTAAAKAAKRKSKASQQHGRGMVGGGQHKLTGRNSCVIGLTLVVALSLLAVAATLLYQHFVMAPSRNSHTQRLKIVKRILRDVPLVDGHNNFAWNVRKYAHSSLELVHVSNDINHKSMWVRPAWAQTDMERLKMGQVGVQVWSAYVPCEAQGLDAVQLALEQIDIIRRLTDMYHQDTVLVQSSKDIQMAQRQGLISSLIGIEGGHAIGSSLGVLRSFYSLGARYLSLTHKCDVSWAGSSSTAIDAGLSQFGKAIIREMNRLGMMIDLSYSSDNTARDVLSATRAPVIFSHSGARQLCNSTRNVPDDILRLVAENGGLVMVSFDSEDVACGRQSRLKDVVDHIKYIRTIAGIQHIGLGAGYDGIELPPIGLEDVSKYPDLLATLLEDPNWSEEDIAMLAGKNFLRIMETVENVRDYWKRAAIQPIEQTEPQPKSQCAYMAS